MYELTQTNHCNIANPGAAHIIAPIERNKYLKKNKYYITMHKWDREVEKGAFVMPHHGNVSQPTAATCHRTDL